MDEKKLLEKVKTCRLADLSDAMDALGLVNKGTMSSSMRPIRPGISMAGFAYTVKLIPYQGNVPVCKDFEEYNEVVHKYAKTPYSFADEAINDGKGKNRVIVIDSAGYPGAIWGSDFGLHAKRNGVAGAVLDGGCRDIQECIKEELNVWCTKITCNHIYGRTTKGGFNVPVQCAGVTVNPGDLVCGDDDGVLVIPREVAEKVVEIAIGVHTFDQEHRAKQYKEMGLEYDETLGDVKI